MRQMPAPAASEPVEWQSGSSGPMPTPGVNMFDRLRRSAHIDHLDHLDTDALKERAAEAAVILADAGTHAAGLAHEAAVQARDAADQAKEWSAPRIEAFVDWLLPRLEHAWQE